jgi:hypothetical protein
MALVLANRVQETTTTTGTGTVTLAGAVSGFQSFAAIGNANTTYYTITSGTAWEVGIGTYTLSGTTLARTTILSSSAAGAAITLAGTSNVFATYPAEKSVNLDASGIATFTASPQTDAANGFALYTADPASYNISRSGTTVSVKSGGDIRLNAGGVLLTASLANGVQVTGVLGATTSLTTPLIIGGTAVSSTLTLQSTSGAGTSDAILFKTASQTERMRITTAGDVGIGTSTPNSRLHVSYTNDSATAFTGFVLSSLASTTGRYLPSIIWAYGSSGTPTFASIDVLRGSGTGGIMVFNSADTAGTNTERMRITTAGDVGIGNTPSGTFKLEVTGAVSASTSLTTPLHSGGTAAASTLTLQSTSGAGTTDFIAFKTASQTERMRITTAGNVGIGSTAATAGRLTITSATDPSVTPAGVAVVMTATVGGTAAEQYGVNVTGTGYSTATAVIGVRASVGHVFNNTVYAVYGDASGQINSVTKSYGVYGRAANTSDTTSNLTAGQLPVGVYGEVYDSFGTLNNSDTAAGYFNNKATLGAASYGIYVNTVAGPTAIFPVRVNHASVELFRITSTGQTLVVATAGGLGYGTGSGGAVTQATSRTTGVTLNKANGAITLVSAAGSVTYQSFTVTNSTVAATDTVIVSQKSGTDLNMIFVTAVAAGSFRISFATTGGTTTEQPVFNFAVIKAVAA